jgi:hypothetical protein
VSGCSLESSRGSIGIVHARRHERLDGLNTWSRTVFDQVQRIPTSTLSPAISHSSESILEYASAGSELSLRFLSEIYRISLPDGKSALRLTPNFMWNFQRPSIRRDTCDCKSICSQTNRYDLLVSENDTFSSETSQRARDITTNLEKCAKTRPGPDKLLKSHLRYGNNCSQASLNLKRNTLMLDRG